MTRKRGKKEKYCVIRFVIVLNPWWLQFDFRFDECVFMCDLTSRLDLTLINFDTFDEQKSKGWMSLVLWTKRLNINIYIYIYKSMVYAEFIYKFCIFKLCQFVFTLIGHFSVFVFDSEFDLAKWWCWTNFDAIILVIVFLGVYLYRWWHLLLVLVLGVCCSDDDD